MEKKEINKMKNAKTRKSFQSKHIAILLTVYRTIDKQSKRIGFKDWMNLSAVDAKSGFETFWDIEAALEIIEY